MSNIKEETEHKWRESFENPYPRIEIKDRLGRTTITFDGHEIKGLYGYRVWRDGRTDLTHIQLDVQDDEMTMDFDGRCVPELPEAYKLYYKPIDERWEKSKKAADVSED